MFGSSNPVLEAQQEAVRPYVGKDDLADKIDESIQKKLDTNRANHQYIVDFRTQSNKERYSP